MNIDFNQPVLDLLGNPIPSKDNNGSDVLMFSPILANALINPDVKIGDYLKKFSLAQKIARKEVLDLDEADLKLIRDIIDLPDILTPLVRAQIFLLLQKQQQRQE